MEIWQLFVDESGEHVHRRDVNVVTGLLIQEPDQERLGEVLRPAVQGVYPLVPYPPHASHLRVGASRVAGFVLSPDPVTSVEREIAHRVEPAYRAVAAAGHSSVALFKEALSSGQWPRYRALQACDAWLADAHPRVHDDLDRLVQEQYEAMGGLLIDLSRRYGSHRCFLVAAASAADNAPPGSTGDDLYLTLLQDLFDRVVALLRSRDGEKRLVLVEVAGRDLRHGPHRRRRMGAPDLAAIRARALGFPHLAPKVPELSPPLRMITGRPVDLNHDQTAHPGLVLADHLSNRLFGALCSSQTHGWERLKVEAGFRFAVPLETVMRGAALKDLLPGLASDGRPSAAVRGAFGGVVPPDLTNVTPPWAREQAEAWVAAALSCRGAAGRGGQA